VTGVDLFEQSGLSGKIAAVLAPFDLGNQPGNLKAFMRPGTAWSVEGRRDVELESLKFVG
jgi:hypothetical protein